MSSIDKYFKDIKSSISVDINFTKEGQKIYKIIHNDKFLSYVDISSYTLNDIRGRSKAWMMYKKKIIKNIHTNLKSDINVICLIPVLRNHSILKKSINSITAQTIVPHIILIVSSRTDKNFAILYNFDYIYIDDTMCIDDMLQHGLYSIKDEYPTSSVVLCKGAEIYTKKWIEECRSINNIKRTIGFNTDYIIDRKMSAIYHRRSEDILDCGIYMGVNILKKNDWKIVINQPTYIKNANMVTVYMGADILTYVSNYKVNKVPSIPFKISINRSISQTYSNHKRHKPKHKIINKSKDNKKHTVSYTSDRIISVSENVRARTLDESVNKTIKYENPKTVNRHSKKLVNIIQNVNIKPQKISVKSNNSIIIRKPQEYIEQKPTIIRPITANISNNHLPYTHLHFFEKWAAVYLNTLTTSPIFF